MLSTTLLLSILMISWSKASSSQHIRNRELTRKNKQITKPCTLYKRAMRNEVGKETVSWDCLLDAVDGHAFVAVSGLNLTKAISGETTLFAPRLAVIDNRVSIPNATEVEFGMIKKRDRRLAVTGNINVVVVRVTCGDKALSSSLEAIKADVFADDACLKSQVEACSNGALKVSPGVLNGGVDVSISSCSDHNAARDATTNALTTALGKFPGFMWNTYFMYCLPPGIAFDGMIAYAHVNSWMTVYSDGWRGYVSGQVHELGHNFGLDHAGEGGLPYDDQTGLMGYSYNVDDLRMCYNAANMYQLGWLKQVQEYSSRPSGTVSLVGHTNYGGGLQAIRLQGTPASRDTYIWFNDASGINADTQEGRNQVIVTTRPSGTGYGPTSMIAKLSVGVRYAPIDAYYSFQVIEITNGKAVISFDSGLDIYGMSAVSVPSPTVAPVSLPAPVPITTSAPRPCQNFARRWKCPRTHCVFRYGRCRPL